MQLARRNSSFYRSSDKEVLPVCAPKQAEAKSSVCFSLGCVLGGLAVICLLFLRAPQFFGLAASGASAPGPNAEPVMSQARISALEAALEPARAPAADWRAAADAAKATSTRGVAERAARAATTPRGGRRGGRRRRLARADRRRVVRGRGRALRRLGVAGRGAPRRS